MAKISTTIVMPSFNQGRFLGEAARSVLRQGGDDVELIVMDGGSADDSLSVLATLSREFAGRVRWYSGPDAGPADAINKAMAMAGGDIIGWLNSDDVYARGAIGRASRYLRANPNAVMVYGRGRHIDGCGRVIEEYPTLPPDAGVEAFADGCFICQPTAFFRRDAFELLGGLDAAIRASFDYDLWLRLFKRFPGRVGFINKVQACTRLHEQTITRRMRETIAVEGLAVTARHLGKARAHWMLTHFDELIDEHPFHDAHDDLNADRARLAHLAAPYLDTREKARLEEGLRANQRAALAGPGVMVDVYADGWAAPTLDVRVLQGEPPVREVTLCCRHTAPGARPLRLTIVSPGDGPQTRDVAERGEFELRLPAVETTKGSRLLFRIYTDGWFTPSKQLEASEDDRRLAFMVDRCVLS